MGNTARNTHQSERDRDRARVGEKSILSEFNRFFIDNKMNYKLGKYLFAFMNRLKTATSRVVTGFDVNILVSSCLISMFTSVFGLRNTQQMNYSLNKVICLDSMRFFFSF